MASVTSGPFGFLSERGSLLRPTACLRPSLAFLRLADRPRRSLRTCCEAKSNPTEPPEGDPPPEFDSGVTTSVENSSASTQSEWFPALPNKSINRRIALASTFAALGLFVSSRLDLGVSLKDLSSVAVPYEEALLNGRPTVVEFYADWCEVCRELAPDIYRVEQKFKDHVNFVMLNVDNTKWEQELDEFDVEGIPHFTFLDKSGNAKGSIVGRLPKKYLLENVESLARGEPSVPHSRVVGQFSSAESRKANLVADPRSHG